jgi:pyridoxal phosphate enzyme (YggS family)
MVRDNLFKIRERLAAACAKVNRLPADITVVAVSKGRSIQEIEEAIACGITDIGENRVQEAVTKYNGIRNTDDGRRIKWHLVGHLQTNKAKEAVKIFDLIHSVDSLRLAKELDKQAARVNKVQDILIEVKTSPEEAKFGVSALDAPALIAEIAKLKNIKLKGLMTIAPLVENPEQARPYFKLLRDLSDRICGRRTTDDGRRILSMGMTDDFEIAIEEGANMLRLGRAIFA